MSINWYKTEEGTTVDFLNAEVPECSGKGFCDKCKIKDCQFDSKKA